MSGQRSRWSPSLGGRLLAVGLAGGFAVSLVATSAGVAGAGTSPQIAQARKDLLVLKDLPKGWTSSKAGSSSNSTPGAAQLARCLGVPLSVITAKPPTAFSRNFNSKDGQLTVQDNVSIYPSAQAAQADFGTFSNPRTPACLTSNDNGPGRAQMASETGAGKGLGQVEVSREPAGNFAKHTANYVTFIPITSAQQTLNVQFTVVDYIKGNEEQTVAFTSYNGQFPAALSRHLTTVAAGRL
jgi:hypothetical protein